jgi:hypothetical protein
MLVVEVHGLLYMNSAFHPQGLLVRLFGVLDHTVP